MRDPATHSRRGLAIFLVFGIIVVLGLSFFFLTQNAIQMRKTTVSILEEARAESLGRAGAELFWDFLQDILRERRGCSRLFPAPPGLSPLDFPRGGSLDGLTLTPADFQEQAAFEQALNLLRAKFPDDRLLGFTATVNVLQSTADMVFGTVQLEVAVKIGKNPYEFTFPRDFRLVQALPPVLSKFTLFVRTVANPEQFNQVPKAYQQDNGTPRPLLLRHSRRAYDVTAPDLWRESGWVFLGGSNVTINLDGSHPCREESEFFLFWPNLYTGSAGGGGNLPYACSPYIGSSKLRVRLTPIGCMDDWASPGTMNTMLGASLGPSFAKTSAIRFFGTRQNLSPTRVIGNVFSRYVLYATLIYDADGDGVADQITHGGTTQKMIFPLARLDQSSAFAPPLSPQLKNSRGFDLITDGAGMAGVPAALTDVIPGFAGGSPDDYVTYMTKVSGDFTLGSGIPCFNSLYDHVFDNVTLAANKYFPAPKLLTPSGTGCDYPNDGRAFVLPADRTGSGELFRGDLTALRPESRFANLQAVTEKYVTAADFFAHGPLRKVGAVWRTTRPAVALVEEDLDLSAGLELTGPLVLVSRGNVKVGAVRRKTPSGYLACWTLKDRITATGGPLAGSFLAPTGTFTWSGALALEGHLAVNTFAPHADGPGGGTLQYEPECDPTDPAARLKGFCLCLEPDPFRVAKR